MTNSKEKQREYHRRWYYKNKERTRLVKNIQQNKDRFGGNRDTVLWLDNYKCRRCLVDRDLTVDHIDQDRTNNKISNLQTLCRSCHGVKDGQTRKIKSGWHWHTEAKGA